MTNSKISTKILISYHKKDSLLKDDVLTPINAGRELAIASQKPDLPWLLENCIGDNEGENISSKNLYYNEMTSIYWAWKNYEKLGNPDYIGHFHYRRHLCFKNYEKPIYEFGDISEQYLTENLGYSSEILEEYCSKYQLIVPRTQWRASAYEHYKRNFDISELDLAVTILKNKFPDFAIAADKYLKSTGLYFCNIFIMSRDIFLEYCNFIFTILQEYESLVDMTGKRMYISEWITGIFIYKKISEGINTLELPTAVAQAPVTIPVIFAADNNYAMQMGVSITSLLCNKNKSTIYDIRCLVSEDFTQGNKNTIKKLCSEFPDCSIEFYNANETEFKDVKLTTSHLSHVAFSRLMIAEMFQDLDKAIYLDDDIIVCEDLAIFYRYSLDDKYFGGIKAPGYYYPEEWRADKLKELKIPTIDQYINSGVLLMNLKQIRKDNLTETFLKLSKNNYRSEDQDIINVACFGKIRILPFRFNAQIKYLSPNSNERYKLDAVVPKDEIKDAINNPTIIHYANKVKPWQDNDVWKSDLWLDYALLSPYSSKVWTLPAEKQRKIKKLREKLGKDIIAINSGIELEERPYEEPNYAVSIIIPCYNSELTISECLMSALEETATLSNIEIICIDDGSTDNTLNCLLRWSKLWPNIKVLHQENLGAGIARNAGMKIAKGEYIAFLDGDDMYPSPTTLENMYYSAKSKNALICGGSFSTLNQGKINTHYEYPLDGYTFTERKMIKYTDYQFDYGYTRFIYQNEFLKTNNLEFPDCLRYQDPPFFVKAMTLAKEFYAIPECTYRYRIMHKTISWNERKVADMIKAMTQIFDWSKNNNLSTLHYYNYVRLKGNLPIIQNYLTLCDSVIFDLYESMLNCIDLGLLQKSEKYKADEITNISPELILGGKKITILEEKVRILEGHIKKFGRAIKKIFTGKKTGL